MYKETMTTEELAAELDKRIKEKKYWTATDYKNSVNERMLWAEGAFTTKEQIEKFRDM